MTGKTELVFINLTKSEAIMLKNKLDPMFIEYEIRIRGKNARR